MCIEPVINAPSTSLVAIIAQFSKCVGHAGHLGNAVLDVVRTEPLPRSSRLWTHPKVRITPHISSMTMLSTAIEQVLENYDRVKAGVELHNLVNVADGY
jgi:glyoxylate/hydroxypyruvate reductase